MTKKRPCKKHSLAKFRTLDDFFAKNIPQTPKIELRQAPINKHIYGDWKPHVFKITIKREYTTNREVNTIPDRPLSPDD
jgi:hypothetical protein